MELRHGRVALALRRLRAGEGEPLLLLHALYGSSADWGSGPEWPGPVYALDFAGHGGSGWVRGGVYYPELLCADADAALSELGAAALVGRGLGAYAALLLAGGRPALVSAAVLLPGAGLEGGGGAPRFDFVNPGFYAELSGEGAASDPYLGFCEQDIRPPEYAAGFARAARRLLLVGGGAAGPLWWEAVRAEPGTEVAADLESALRAIASPPGR